MGNTNERSGHYLSNLNNNFSKVFMEMCEVNALEIEMFHFSE
jgi:hypothetical protein